VQAKAGRLAVDFHRRSVVFERRTIDWGGTSKVMYSDATVECTLCLRLVAGTTGEKKKEKRIRIRITLTLTLYG